MNPTITAIVKNVFGQHTGILSSTPLLGGDFNSTFYVNTSEGEVVVRFPPVPTELLYRFEKHLLQAEVEAYKGLSSIGVPTPTVLSYDSSFAVTPSEYLVVTFLPGVTLRNATLSEEERARIDEELGMYFRKMHTLEGEGFGFLSDTLSPSWFEFLTRLTDEIAERSERWKITPLTHINKLRQMLHSNRALFSPPSPRFLHNDLHDRNVLIARKEEGGVSQELLTPTAPF